MATEDFAVLMFYLPIIIFAAILESISLPASSVELVHSG